MGILRSVYFDVARDVDLYEGLPVSTQKAKYAATVKPWTITCLAASIAIVIGSLGPWVTIFAFSQNGTEGDGAITVALGGLAALLSVVVIVREGRALLGDRYITPLLALVVSIIALYDVANVGNTKGNFMGAQIGPSVGWGLWLVLIGGLTLLAASILVAAKGKNL
ncbi:hypothetical protein QM797_09550 [Rhodococcus sp. IEGM 1381]|uniref:hypothetical protein n=1 Tax=Rhodococcus sp. IEGM 1381 TaxID=3047085 RepID=UPI0024B726C6|nr:hypothetical protein [Rhodococcus sp. IEGM 1381]MDI9894970.1 hypothetical protein [Rhodococcus sp. IEGM 1381]